MNKIDVINKQNAKINTEDFLNEYYKNLKQN